LDERLLRFVVGLALESALVHRRDNRTLVSLHSDPDLERVRELYDELMVSGEHYDREVAIWLELALEQGPLLSDPLKLVREMREMEVILYTLIPRSGEARRNVNVWLNFIANTAHTIEDGFWIDAKVLLSRALQSSQHPSVEELKAYSRLRYEVDVLQKATASYFEEMKKYPLRLRVPEERLDALLEVQDIMLELMHIHYREEPEEGSEVPRSSIYRLSTAIRYLMDERRELMAAKREVRLASEEMAMRLNEIVDEERSELMDIYGKRIKEVINIL